MNFSDVALPSNQKFGFFFTAVFAVVGAYLLTEDSLRASYLFFSLAVIFLLVTAVKAEFLLPLNKLWMRFGMLLGMLISPIVLGIIFFGLFTPISILMRLFGRDELRLKLANRASHWKERNQPTTSYDAFKRQF